jgi:hypothetical protein
LKSGLFGKGMRYAGMIGVMKRRPYIVLGALIGAAFGFLPHLARAGSGIGWERAAWDSIYFMLGGAILGTAAEITLDFFNKPPRVP